MAATALAVPALLAVAIGNALLVVFLLGGHFIDLLYAFPGFPAAESLDRETRRALAVDGMAAIRPLGPGAGILREAELPSGVPAFNSREVLHMEDVRAVVAGFAWAWLAGAVLLLAAWASRARLGGAARVRYVIGHAALASIVLVALAGVLFLVAFEPVFEGFHAIFFSGDSWRFPAGDTLLQLYPEMFWAAAGTLLVILVVAQCLAVRYFPWPVARRRSASGDRPARGA